MTETEIIDMVSRFYSNKFTKKDVKSLLKHYCISMGKPALGIELFIETAMAFGMELELYNYVIDYYTRKYNLILLTDKKGKFIKVLKNEETDSKAICHSEEGSPECEPSGSEEKQDH